MNNNRFRVPPQDIDAEMSVLGAMLLGNETRCMESAEILEPADFYRGGNGVIYQAITGLMALREPVDIVTVKDALTTSGMLEHIGGVEYLMQLAEFVPSSANARHYAKIVKHKSTLRRVIAFADEASAAAYTDPDEEATAALIERIERQVLGLRSSAENKGPRRMVDIAGELFDKVEARQLSGGGLIGESTGSTALDWYLSGLVPGNFYIMAGRPSMGKTSAAVSIALNLVRQGGNVVFFSLEMSEEELVENAITTEAKIDGHALRIGLLSEGDWVSAQRALDRTGFGLYVDDNQAATVGYIGNACRRLTATYGRLSAIFVDYIGLMGSGDGQDGENRNLEISEISRGLKKLARELGVPVVALGQLNRGVEKRENKRPMLSDLRDSGSLEQDADVVIFLYRPSYYAPKEAASESTERQRFQEDPTEFIIAKNRKGQTGTARLGFIPAYRAFVDIDPEEIH